MNTFLLLVGVAGSGSWFAFMTVLFYIDPEASGRIGVAAFYISLFLALLATFTLVGLGGRIVLKKYQRQSTVLFRVLLPAIRQSVWLSAIVVVSFILLAAHVFTVWSMAILLIGFTILEAFYLSRTTNERSQAHYTEVEVTETDES